MYMMSSLFLPEIDIYQNKTTINTTEIKHLQLIFVLFNNVYTNSKINIRFTLVLRRSCLTFV